MKMICKAIPLTLLICLLSGCSYQTYTKTVVLPSRNKESAAESPTEDGDWTLKRIYQYQYASNNVLYSDIYTINGSSDTNRYQTSYGWSGDEHLLYTLDGGKGEEVIINKVDIRYGFYEECANLGLLNYNQMQLSPDGKYLLYDVNSDDGNSVNLNLYCIADQSTKQILEFPHTDPSFVLDFTWAGDGSCFFAWFALSKDATMIDKIFSENNASELSDYYKSILITEEGESLFNQLIYYNLKDEQRKHISYFNENYIDNESIMDSIVTIIPSTDGSRILVKYNMGFEFSIINTSTEEIINLESSYIASYGIDPQPYLFSQITDNYICAFDNNDSTKYFINYEIPDIRISKPSIPENRFLLTNDETHLIQIEYGDNKETLVYLYTCSNNNPKTLTEKTLLYQCKDEISMMSVTPDNKYIILHTQNNNELSYSSNEATDADGNYLEQRTISADYLITVLEL